MVDYCMHGSSVSKRISTYVDSIETFLFCEATDDSTREHTVLEMVSYDKHIYIAPCMHIYIIQLQ